MEDSKKNKIFTRKDLAIGTIIAIVMAITFSMISRGITLLVTFLPGIVFVWLSSIWIYKKEKTLPEAKKFIPLYFLALSVQFLHFAEEFTMGFATQFSLLYGAEPYSSSLFVAINMCSYFVFTIACILMFYKSLNFLFVPVMFFITYGVMANAIAHTFWSVYLGLYFPGLITAQLYWVLGPLLIYRVFNNRKETIIFISSFAIVLIALLTFFSQR